MLKELITISVVMPCLNEEKTVGSCVANALEGIKRTHLIGEVVVCDNGSSDNSVKVAKKAGARVVFQSLKGYGSAYLKGIQSSRGQWIVMGDSDGTYDFRQIPQLTSPLSQGYDLVLGSRLKGKINKKSMPFLNRYLGTPLLNLFIRIFFNLHISDSQSGMRAFTKLAYNKLHLKTLGMEFASEMLIRAGQEHLKITEVPINYSPRVSPTKLARFKDAWRHIRFMLLFAPTYLYLIPGGIFMVVGLFGLIAIAQGPVTIFSRGLDFHSMIFASMLMLMGFQVIMLGVYAKTFSLLEEFSKKEALISITLRHFRLEGGIIAGLAISLAGFLIGLNTFFQWANTGFGALWAIRPAIVSMTFFVLGIQILFSSFFLSLLGFKQEIKSRQRR